LIIRNKNEEMISGGDPMEEIIFLRATLRMDK
jgi:hypothetical protein